MAAQAVSGVEEVIRAVRARQAGAAELYPALAAAPLLFAIEGGEGDVVRPVVQRWNDADHGLVFTSHDRATGVPGIPGLAELSGRELGGRWPDGLRAAVNVGSDDVGIVLDSDAMHAVGAVPDTVPAGTVVMVGAPADPPAPELVEALRAAVRGTAGVSAGYLFQQATPGGTSRMIAGLDLDDPAAAPEVVPDVARTVAAAHPPARNLDFTALHGELRRMVLGAVLAIT
jgi:hypothetical protein